MLDVIEKKWDHSASQVEQIKSRDFGQMLSEAGNPEVFRQ